MVSMSDPHFTLTETRVNLTDEKNPTNYLLADSSFNIAFGLVGDKVMTPDIGYFEAFYTSQTIDNSAATPAKDKIKRPLKLVPCQANEWAINERFKSKWMNSLLESLLCIDKEDLAQIKIAGGYFSSEFDYIEINLHLCEGVECATRKEMQAFFGGKE